MPSERLHQLLNCHRHCCCCLCCCFCSSIGSSSLSCCHCSFPHAFLLPQMHQPRSSLLAPRFTRFVTHHLVSHDLSHAASLQAPAAGLSTQTIAIIAGCSCGGVLLIAAAAYMIRRRRLALQPSTTAPSPASAPAMEMAPVHQLPVEAWKQQQQQQQQQHDHVSHVPHVLQQA